MDGWVKIGTELDTKSFDSQIEYVKSQMQEIEDKLLKADMGFEVGDTQKLEAQYETLVQKLGKLQQKQSDINNQGFSKVESSLQNVGKKTDSVVRKIAKWGLAVFGIRSAYLGIRKAISSVRAENEQVDASFKAIGSFFASVFEPVVIRIVGWMTQLIQYVNYLAKAWFGVDFLAKSNEKSLKGANKQAKELRKTLSGFDEMNVINDSGGTSGVGGGIGDLPIPEDFPVPKWLEWIKDNGGLIAKVLIGIGTAFLAIKLLLFIDKASKAIDILKKLSKAFFSLKTLGIAVAIAGLVLIIKNVADLIFNWETLTAKEKILRGAFVLLGIAAIALGYAIATGISVATLGIGALIGGATALVIGLVGLITKFVSEEKAIKSVAKAQRDLTNAQNEYIDANDKYINAVDKSTEAFEALEQAQKDTGISGKDLYDKVEQGTLNYADMNEKQKLVYKAYLDNDRAQKELKTSTEELTIAKQNEKIASWENKLAVAAEKGEYDKYKKSVVDAFNKGELKADEARTLIGKSMSGMSRDAQQTFMKDLPNSIKNGLEPKNFETAGQKLRKWFEGLWSNIKSGWNSVSSWFGNLFSGKSGAKMATGGIILPKMATGGIINNPNHGVPVGGRAIGGESGAEGVIPLTDSQAMETLGNAIGRYITINANIPVNMNGRTISREIKKVNTNDNFVMNR